MTAATLNRCSRDHCVGEPQAGRIDACTTAFGFATELTATASRASFVVAQPASDAANIAHASAIFILLVCNFGDSRLCILDRLIATRITLRLFGAEIAEDVGEEPRHHRDNSRQNGAHALRLAHTVKPVVMSVRSAPETPVHISSVM